MSWQFCLILFIGVLLEWKLTLSAPAEIGKTNEKGRAYEFGFSIEEQQHRHEKKDENGIVMGEFGFITADGIYHVTVYATDENGKFKIISMKNYPYGNPEEKIMIARLPPPKKPAVTTPTEVKAMMPDGKSCGGCVLPKKSYLQPADVKSKKPEDEKAVFRPLSKPLNDISSNGKTNGGAANLGKSSPTKQSKSLSMSTSSGSSAGANGKGSSASEKPLSELSKISPLIRPRFSNSKAQTPLTVGATSSNKVDPKISANNGNQNQITNFLTQTTQTPTPTRHFTQISATNKPKINTQIGLSSQENQLSSRFGNILPTKKSNSLSNFNNQPTTLSNTQNLNLFKQLTRSSTDNTNNTPQNFKNSLSNTTPTLLQFPRNEIVRKTINQETTAAKISKGSRFQSQDSQFSTTTESKPLSAYGFSQKTKFSNPTVASSNFPTRPNVPIDFGTPSQIPQANRRNPSKPATKYSQPSKSFKNSQTLYNKDYLTTKSPTKPYGPTTSLNTNTTPQYFPNYSLKNTNPPRPSTQFSKNNEHKSMIRNHQPETNNRFGFSNQENQLNSHANRNNLPPGRGENQQTTKFPNPLRTSTNPFVVPTIYNTNTNYPSSSVSPSIINANKSFAIPAFNRKTSTSTQQQQGPTKTQFTQNSVKPILKSTKESKPFQTLSKLLPDNNVSKQSGAGAQNSQLSQQTPKITPFTSNTVVQKPSSGQSPTLVNVNPQSIGKNTLTQPQLTAKTLTPPKRLQQNTNGAKTTTPNTQSTNKQTPVAPSSQAAPSINAGGASSSKANVGGVGGGPLYRFNYVLDYNSHREEGRIDGSKEGKYNTIHDDGIRRIIDYIANENGYQPHIKLQRPPPNELPTGENKLKEYEFVWFN